MIITFKINACGPELLLRMRESIFLYMHESQQPAGPCTVCVLHITDAATSRTSRMHQHFDLRDADAAGPCEPVKPVGTSRLVLASTLACHWTRQERRWRALHVNDLAESRQTYFRCALKHAGYSACRHKMTSRKALEQIYDHGNRERKRCRHGEQTESALSTCTIGLLPRKGTQRS